MSMTEPQTPHVCAVCRRVLDYWRDTRTGEGEWKHSIAAAEDHEPSPIPRSQAEAEPEGVRDRCDFCFGDDPHFLVPVRTFADPRAQVLSVEDWLACEPCGLRILRNDWNGLHRRAVAAWEALRGEPLDDLSKQNLRRTYRDLRKNVTGSVIARPK